MVEGYAALFSYTAVVQASDLMTAHLHSYECFLIFIFIYFVTLKTEYYAKGCVRENKSKKFKVRIKRMTVRNENR